MNSSAFAGRWPGRQRGGSDAPRVRAAQLVERINPGAVWTVDEFVASQARRRRRAITVVESSSLVSIDAGVSGQLWIRDGADEIVAAAGISEAERRYVIVHEMGHLLFGHAASVTPDAWTEFFDVVPAQVVRQWTASFSCTVSGPTVSGDDIVGGTAQQEAEAEWFASLLLADVDHKRAKVAARRGAHADQMLDRLGRTFGFY